MKKDVPNEIPVATTTLSSSNSADLDVRRKINGFTLIELLAATAIIAILIGLLLPAIQRRREQVAAEEARTNVQMLIQAATEYRSQYHMCPESLSALAQFCAVNPSLCSLDAALASGEKDGYAYLLLVDVVDGTSNTLMCNIVAEPVRPGITGSMTIQAVASATGGIWKTTNFLTPGSNEAREEMFDRIRERGSQTVFQLLSLDLSVLPQVRGFVEMPNTATNVFNAMETNADGSLSIAEIRDFNGTGYLDDTDIVQTVRGFISFVADEMMWDSLSAEGTNTTSIGPNIPGATSNQPPLFSFDGLGRLSNIVVDGLSGNDMIRLRRLLEGAEQAEDSCNLPRRNRLINSYTTAINSKRGDAITFANARILTTFAGILASSEYFMMKCP